MTEVVDPILEGVDREMEKAQRQELPRRYLGGSAIGDTCERKLFYSFRWSSPTVIEATGLKAIADGHASEAVMIKRLKMVPDVKLWAEEDGKQIGFTDFGGHLQGNLDGVIEHPSIGTAVWENKACRQSKFDKLKKLKDADEATALKQWDIVYYGQAMTYCHYMGIDQHYITVCTPGARDVVSVLTKYDRTYAEMLIEKAKRIIFGNEPGPRLSGDPAYFACKWCQHHSICHGTELPKVSCRTCAHASAKPEGGWSCEKFACDLSEDAQREGCVSHRFHPRLLSGVPVEQTEDGDILYRMNDNGEYWDRNK